MQRAEGEDTYEAAAEDRPERVKKYSSKRSAKRVAEASSEGAAAESLEPAVKVTSEPITEKGSEPAAEAETKPWTVTESKPEAVVENSSVSKPAEAASPSAEAAAPAQQPAPPEPQQDIARLQQPVAPPRPEPSPEVVAVCGAGETACQDQLTALLADPLHKWIDETPTAQDDQGVRMLAYRVLTPVLACDDLRKGLSETQAAAGEPATTEPKTAEEPSKDGKSVEWIQLLRRSVNLELKAEIAKRC